MGLGNKLIVSATGFPGTNKTLRFIQDAFREPLGALAQMAGEKTIITQEKSTLLALDQALILLKSKALLVVTIYPGHPGGETEALAIENWLKVNQKLINGCYKINSIPTNQGAPYTLFLSKC